MQWLLGPYARQFNKRHERDGNLFHTRFYSKRVASDDHLIAAVVYVLLNPVRAGAVEQPEAWKWSSCAATVGSTDAPGFLAVDAVLELVDEHARSARLRLQLALHEARQADRARRGVRRGV